MGAKVHPECTFLHGLVQIQVPRLTWEAASGLVELTRSDADPGFAEEHFFGLKPARGRSCCRRSRGCIYISGLSFTINLIFLEIIFKLFSWEKKGPSWTVHLFWVWLIFSWFPSDTRESSPPPGKKDHKVECSGFQLNPASNSSLKRASRKAELVQLQQETLKY